MELHQIGFGLLRRKTAQSPGSFSRRRSHFGSWYSKQQSILARATAKDLAAERARLKVMAESLEKEKEACSRFSVNLLMANHHLQQL